MADSDGGWWLYVGSVPLAQHTTGGTHYVHTDVRDDVRLVTDTTGVVTDTFTWTIDGVLETRTGTSDVSVGWRGETHDSDTGLVWLRARWYDPTTTRFLSADPWHGDPSNPISLNRYLYGNADAVNMHDPTGLYAKGTLQESVATVSVAQVLYGISVTAGMSVLLAIQAKSLIEMFNRDPGPDLPDMDDPYNDRGIDGQGTDERERDGEPATNSGSSGENPPYIGSTRNCQPDPGDPSQDPRIEPADWNNHIYPRHVAPHLDKSRFFTDIDVLGLICEALDSGAPVRDSNTESQLSNNPQFRVRVYDMGRPVGTSTMGSPNYLTVVTRVSNGTVRTAHPGVPSTW